MEKEDRELNYFNPYYMSEFPPEWWYRRSETQMLPDCDSAVKDVQEYVRVVAGSVPEGMNFEKWLGRSRISQGRYFGEGGHVLVPELFMDLPCKCVRTDSEKTPWVIRRAPHDRLIYHTACGYPVAIVPGPVGKELGDK